MMLSFFVPKGHAKHLKSYEDLYSMIVGACLPLKYKANQMGFSDQIDYATFKYSSPNPAYIAIFKKSHYAEMLGEFQRVIYDIVSSEKVQEIKKVT